MTTTPTPRTHHFRGRHLLLLGLGLAVSGVAAYVVQLALQHLAFPWYMLALAALGVVLVGVSLWEKRTVWRVSW